MSQHNALNAEMAEKSYGILIGRKGAVYIPNFWHPDRAYIIRDGEAVETIEMPFEFPGFQFEIMETMKCIREGKKECDIMPLDESIALSGAMDEMYRQWDNGI